MMEGFSDVDVRNYKNAGGSMYCFAKLESPVSGIDSYIVNWAMFHFDRKGVSRLKEAAIYALELQQKSLKPSRIEFDDIPVEASFLYEPWFFEMDRNHKPNDLKFRIITSIYDLMKKNGFWTVGRPTCGANAFRYLDAGAKSIRFTFGSNPNEQNTFSVSGYLYFGKLSKKRIETCPIDIGYVFEKIMDVHNLSKRDLYGFFHDAQQNIGAAVIDAAENIFEDCGNYEDFHIRTQHNGEVIFGHKNRVIYTPFSGFRLDEEQCEAAFVARFNNNAKAKLWR